MNTDIIPCPTCEGFLTVKSDGAVACEHCGPLHRGEPLPYWELSERRKADRKRMLDLMIKLCDELKVPYTIKREPAVRLGPDWDDRRAKIRITGPTGLSATLDFDGKSWQPDTFVVSWHMDIGPAYDRETIIRADFCEDPEARNPFHKRKATDVCRGFDQLIVLMSRRLQRIADGTATE